MVLPSIRYNPKEFEKEKVRPYNCAELPDMLMEASLGGMVVKQIMLVALPLSYQNLALCILVWIDS